jgi:hypothetical protein
LKALSAFYLSFQEKESMEKYNPMMLEELTSTMENLPDDETRKKLTGAEMKDWKAALAMDQLEHAEDGGELQDTEENEETNDKKATEYYADLF